MNKIILINGFPQSGKDAFCNLLFLSDLEKDYNIKFTSISTVDFVKEIAEKCGWDGEKNLKNRKFLSDLKDLLTEWNDIPIKSIKKKIEVAKCLHKHKINIFFVHTREPEEIERLRNEWDAKSLLIRRASVENNEQSNHADSNVLDCTYDYIIDNNGTLEDLEKSAETFIINILKENWNSYIEEEF